MIDRFCLWFFGWIDNQIQAIENLYDLIELCDKYPLADNIVYNINMSALHKIKPSLVDLQSMVGMKTIKENISNLTK